MGDFQTLWRSIHAKKSSMGTRMYSQNVYLYVFDDVLDVTYLMTLLAPHLVGDLGIPQAKLKINENQSRNVLYVFLTYPKKLLIQRGSQAKLSCYFFSIQ